MNHGVISSARHLQHLLIIHERAAQQVECINVHIEDVSRRLLVNDIGRESRDMSSQYLRLSIAQGVRTMLHNFMHHIIRRVQKLSQEILSYLQIDDDLHPLYPEQTQLEAPSYSITMDTAAFKYTKSVEMTIRND